MLDTIITNGYNVQRTDAYIEQLLTLKEAEAKPKSKGKRTFIVKDIRIFMNTINHAIETMKPVSYTHLGYWQAGGKSCSAGTLYLSGCGNDHVSDCTASDSHGATHSGY